MTLLGRRLLAAMIVMPLAVMLAGCSRKTKVVYVPAPPPPPPITAPKQSPPSESRPTAPAPAIATAGDSADIDFVATHTPISSEEGLASWYGPPYHNRKAANGQVFDQNAMTAAHRTLPLNSLIKVTNTADWPIRCGSGDGSRAVRARPCARPLNGICESRRGMETRHRKGPHRCLSDSIGDCGRWPLVCAGRSLQE